MRLLLTLALLLLAPAARAAPLTVFAAASLTDALRDVGALWEKAGHQPLRFSFGSSATLARQIEQGAPADLFASADERWMDAVAKRDLLVPDTRADLLRNALVLVMPAAQARHVAIGPKLDFAALLGPGGRLAVGDPQSVPVGIYAEQALKHLGLWDQVAARLAPAEDVRAALLLVERGEAAAGIVYATDAAISRKVAVAGTFPAGSHDPVTYPFAAIRGGDAAGARALLDFLRTPAARAAFARRGFGVEGDDARAE